MKKIIFLLLLFVITWDVYSQTTRAATSGFVPRANQTFVVEDGILSARNGLFAPRYTDTTQANTFLFKDTAGAIIYTYATQSLWVRINETASNNKWVAVGAGGGGSGTVTSVSWTGGIVSIANPTTTPAFTIAGTSGGIPYFSSASTWASSGVLANSALVIGGGAGAAPSTTTTGTGVITALGVNVGTAGAFVVNGGALGTPSSGVATNLTGTATALNIGGNAATATALQTGRTISISGDLTYTSPSFDGTGNVTAAGTLATVNSNVGTFGSATQVPQLTVNAKGLITAVSNVTITVPTASLLPITGTGTATGAVIGSLAGNTVNIQQATNSFFNITPTAGSELVYLGAVNTTDNDNVGRFTGSATNTSASFNTIADFNDGVNTAQILGTADATTASLQYNSVAHSFSGTSTTFQTNVGIGVVPTFLLQVQSGGFDLISIDPTAGTETSSLRAINLTDDDNLGQLVFEATNTNITGFFEAEFNGGVKRSGITILADATTATIEYEADSHTFTGNILTATDNTYNIGSSTNSFKDIYARTAIFDGSTSGSFTVFSEATGIAGRGTTASGTGYIPAYMFASQTSTNSLSDVNTVQAIFASGFDVFTLQASTSYFFEGQYVFDHGATSHSVGLSFELGGGASVTSIAYTTTCWVTASNTNTASQTTNFITQTTNTAVNAAGANATERIYFQGIIRMSSGGTVTPSVTFSAAPGGAPTTGINSYIRFTPIGSNTINSLGNVN